MTFSLPQSSSTTRPAAVAQAAAPARARLAYIDTIRVILIVLGAVYSIYRGGGARLHPWAWVSAPRRLGRQTAGHLELERGGLRAGITGAVRGRRGGSRAVETFIGGFTWQSIALNLWIGLTCVSFSLTLILWLRAGRGTTPA